MQGQQEHRVAHTDPFSLGIWFPSLVPQCTRLLTNYAPRTSSNERPLPPHFCLLSPLRFRLDSTARVRQDGTGDFPGAGRGPRACECRLWCCVSSDATRWFVVLRCVAFLGVCRWLSFFCVVAVVFWSLFIDCFCFLLQRCFIHVGANHVAILSSACVRVRDGGHHQADASALLEPRFASCSFFFFFFSRISYNGFPIAMTTREHLFCRPSSSCTCCHRLEPTCTRMFLTSACVDPSPRTM